MSEDFEQMNLDATNLRLFIPTTAVFEPTMFILSSINKALIQDDQRIPVIEYRLGILKFHTLTIQKGVNIVSQMKFLAENYGCDLADTLLMVCIKTNEFIYPVRRDRIYSTRFFDLVQEDFRTGQPLLNPLDWDSASQELMRSLKLENSLLKISYNEVTTINEEFGITIANLQQSLESLREDNTTTNQTLVQKAEENRISIKKNIELSLKLKSMSDFISVLETTVKSQRENMHEFYKSIADTIAKIKDVSVEILTLGGTVKRSIQEETFGELNKFLDVSMKKINESIKDLDSKFKDLERRIEYGDVQKEKKTSLVEETEHHQELPRIDIGL